MEYDAKTKQFIVNAVPAVSIEATGDTVGVIIDTKLFESLTLALIVSTFSGTGNVTLELEHGDDPALGDSVAVPAADLIGTIKTLSADEAINRVGYIGKLRFVRATIAAVETATLVAICGVTAIQANPQNAPTVDQ